MPEHVEGRIFLTAKGAKGREVGGAEAVLRSRSLTPTRSRVGAVLFGTDYG